MAVAAAARRLEDELCRGNTKGIDPEPCPREGTRLAFYITSLTKPGTQRDAAAQLKVALPLNLFLALQSREWATFYVSLSELLCQSSIIIINIFSYWQQSSSTRTVQIRSKVVTFADDAELHTSLFFKLRWAIAHGYLKVASGGDYASAVIRARGNPQPMLSHWHASVAKNTAAEFAISSELAQGTSMQQILLCNLDGDNIMLPNFPSIAVALTSRSVSVQF